MLPCCVHLHVMDQGKQQPEEMSSWSQASGGGFLKRNVPEPYPILSGTFCCSSNLVKKSQPNFGFNTVCMAVKAITCQRGD